MAVSWRPIDRIKRDEHEPYGVPLRVPVPPAIEIPYLPGARERPTRRSGYEDKTNQHEDPRGSHVIVIDIG